MNVGNLVCLSGTLPTEETNVVYAGRVETEQSVKSRYEAAKLCLLNALSHLGAASDQFDRLERIVRLAGYVNGVGGFSESPKVINSASDPLANYRD